MNKIVREHYPVERLPEDLRAELPDRVTVRLTLEAESTTLPAGRAWVEDIVRRRANIAETSDDPVARVRQLRDEWND